MSNPTPERDRQNRLLGGRPTNQRIANKNTAFVFDHERQMPIAPAGKFATGSDQRASQGGMFAGRTMNSDGRAAAALHVGVGGSPDTRGVVNFMGKGSDKPRKTSISQRSKR
jgi:hypothetical protein